MRTVFRLLSRACAIMGALVVLVTVMPARWYVDRLAGPWPEQTGGTLIVLGAEQLDGRMPGTGSYWRSVHAVLAWREGTFHRVVLSGHSVITFPMRDFLVCQGVPSDAVLVERESTSTHENAVFTAQLMTTSQGPFVLLTSDFHMWRAIRAFRKAGLNVVPRPIPDAGRRWNDWHQRLAIVLDLAGESTKIVYYKWQGWI